MFGWRNPTDEELARALRRAIAKGICDSAGNPISRDSGSFPKGRDRRARGEAKQSGPRRGASPNLRSLP